VADTIGSLIDKLVTVDLKMWNNQELLYEIRRMTCDEFIQEYHTTSALSRLYSILKKCCDLNIQRNVLIDEVDTLLVEMFGNPEMDDGRYIQRKHKTY